MKSAAAGVFTLVFVVAVLSEGPFIERGWWPVLSVSATDVQGVAASDVPSGTEAVFNLVGTKLRSCALDSYSVGWRFDHSIIPTILLDKNHQQLAIPKGIQAGEQFSLGPFYVPVPSIVSKAMAPRLLLTYYYNCHALYLTEQDLMIPIPAGALK